MVFVADTRVTWNDVLKALRGGEYTQGSDGMCYVPDLAFVALDGTGDVYKEAYHECQWCPLGIIRNLAGARWSIRGTDNFACDQDGETEVPSMDLLESLGLTGMVYAETLGETYREAVAFNYGSDSLYKWEVISFLNDSVGFTLGQIANEIERLGWSNDYGNTN